MRIIVAFILLVLSASCSHQETEQSSLPDRSDPSKQRVIDTNMDASSTRKASKMHASESELNGAVMASTTIARGSHLEEILRAPAQWVHQPYIEDSETYQHNEENGVMLVAQQPVSTFSVDVDTAAYSNIRRMIMAEGRLPPHDAVRIEEMINYFSYNYQTPDNIDRPFSVVTEIAPAPWNPRRLLLQIGLKGFEPVLAKRPAANLVFLIDVSGSMRAANKLPLVKKSLRLLVNKMKKGDSIALVVYAGAAGLVLDSTDADKKAKIMLAIDSLESGGSTNGGDGIRLAYAVAQEHFVEGAINRVLIASDGDMNVGTTDINALKSLIQEKRELGIALTTLGFGTGNYNSALMEQLADVGNGNAAYIDSLREAQKVLVEEMQSTLLTIAKDVKIQIEFNPGVVAEYRLIGYENRMLKREDFRNDKVDAGEVGAGHTVTALYELVMVDSGADLIAPLRYKQDGTSDVFASKHDDEIAFVSLRYKQPDAASSIEFSVKIQRHEILSELTDATNDFRFASAVAGFGQLLRGGKYTEHWDYEEVLTLARSARGSDYHGYRSELVGLVELAQSLSASMLTAIDN